MTEEQAERLIGVLERIAECMEATNYTDEQIVESVLNKPLKKKPKNKGGLSNWVVAEDDDAPPEDEPSEA